MVPGTDQYTFTEEQIQQKLLKRQRMVSNVAVVSTVVSTVAVEARFICLIL